MTPFTAGWAVFLLFMVGVTVGAHLALRRRTDPTQRRWLLALAVLNWVFSTWFTFDRAANPEFYFPITQNLPLHFCTIVTFLLIPTVWFTRGRWLGVARALVFFPGLVAAFLVLFSPAAEYTGQPYWSMNTLFYVVHALNVVIPVLMVSLGHYRPTLRDSWMSMVYFTALALLVILPLTVLLRATLDPGSNYFYFFDPEGADLLVMLWDAIGIPVVYQLPLPFLVMPVVIGIYYLYRAIDRFTARESRRRSLGATPACQESADEDAVVLCRQ